MSAKNETQAVDAMSIEAQGIVVSTIERFVPQETKMSATEIMTYMVNELDKHADENPVLLYLAANQEKSFDANDMKKIAANHGVQELEAFKEVKNEADQEKSAKPEVTATETVSKPAEGTKSTEQNMDTPAKEGGGSVELSPEEKAVLASLSDDEVRMLNDLKKQFSTQNQKELKNIDPNQREVLATKAALMSMQIAKQKQVEKAAENLNQKGGTVRRGAFETLAKGASDVMGGIGRQVAKVTSDSLGGAKLAGGSAVTGLGMAAKGLGKASKTIGLAGKNLKNAAKSATESNYQTKILNSSAARLDAETAQLAKDIKTFNYKRETNSHAGYDSMEAMEKASLEGIAKRTKSVQELANTVKNDSRREGVQEKAKFKAIESLERTKAVAGRVSDSLDAEGSEHEKRAKEMADALVNSIKRILTMLKNLFGKKKEKEGPKKPEPQDEPTLGM